MLGRVTQRPIDCGNRHICEAVAGAALQSAGEVTVQLDFDARGDRFVSVLIHRQTGARIGLQRDQMVDPVAENATRQREMLPESLLDNPLDAADGLWLESWIILVKRSEVRR